MREQQSKKPIIRFILSVMLLIVVIGALLMAFSKEKEAETQAEFRNLDNLAIKIAEYEMYYRDPHMVSKEEATFQSLYDTLEKYVLIYHLEQAGYDWDEAKRQLHEKTTREAVEYDINHPILKDYFEQMFATLGITKDDYLKQYALIEKEYELKYRYMFEKQLQVDTIGLFHSSDALGTYLNLIGMTKRQLYKLEKKIPTNTKPLDPQPDMPFPTNGYNMQVAKNEAGEYIFASVPTKLEYEERYSDILYALEKQLMDLELSRATLDLYKKALAAYTDEDEEQMKYAKELEAVFEVLERTVNGK